MEHSPEQVIVIDQDGVRGVVDGQALQRQDQKQVLITYNGDRHIQAPRTLLHQQADGTYHLSLRLSTLESNAQLQEAGDATVIPVIQEEAHIAAQATERGRVRITKRVHTHEETVDTPLRQERVQVERVPVAQIVESPVTMHYDGDTLVIPVMEEILVVEKRLLLKEEVRVTKYIGEAHHQDSITVRAEEVDVERTGESATDLTASQAP